MLWRLRRLIALFHRRRLDDQLREEIEHHLELRRQQLVADGVDPREARAAALRAFGNPTRLREESRMLWGFPVLDSLAQDVRFALRLLWRSPAFAAVAVLSLALGMGAAAAVFNVADAVLFRTLAVKAPHELHEFRAILTLGAATKSVNGVSPDGLLAMQRGADFAEFIGLRTLDDGLLGGLGSEPQPVRIELVSGNYFEVLGVAATAGRMLTRFDAGTSPVPIVISERLWRGRFGADRGIAGRSVLLNETPATVVGVARAFRGLLAERPADVMLPADAGALIDSATPTPHLRLVVRLRREVSTAVAEQRMASLFRETVPLPIQRNGEVRVILPDASRGASDARESLQRPVTIGLMLVGVLLLVACANTGGLLLAKVTSRAGEFGVRIAIGAGRTRLLRQLTVEALVVAVLAAAAGLLAARLAAPFLLRTIPLGSTPLDFELRFDWRLAAFTGALAAIGGLICACIPLFRLLRSDPSAILSRNSRSIVRGRRRLTDVLIATQVACSLLLLVSAGAMTRTLINLGRVDPGFDATGVVAITVDATGRTPDLQSLPEYYRRLQERIASMPWISRVSFAQVGLMTSAATTGTVEIAGWSPPSDEDRWVRVFFVGPDFFEALGMRLLAGRSIGRREAAGRERVAVVNRAFADLYFGGVAVAVGRTVNRDVRIIGVAADARYGTLRDEPVRAMFLPYTQAPPRTAMTFVVRTTGRIAPAIEAALVAIRMHDPALKRNVATLDDQIAATSARERFVAVLAAVLSGLALLLSCAGLYAAVAYGVTERRNELAVRLALGATGPDVVRLMLAGPLRVTAIGVVLGIPAAYAVMRAAAALLYEVTPFDVPTIAVCGCALAALACVAAILAARRAAAIDPHECLKCS